MFKYIHVIVFSITVVLGCSSQESTQSFIEKCTDFCDKKKECDHNISNNDLALCKQVCKDAEYQGEEIYPDSLLACTSSESCDVFNKCIAQVTDGDFDGENDNDEENSEFELENLENEQITQKGIPPRPVIELKEGNLKAFLGEQLVFDAKKSQPSPSNPDSKLQYYWEWSPKTKPEYTFDAFLVCEECDTKFLTKYMSDSVIDKWTDDRNPKLYAEFTGTHCLRLKVKDDTGLVSGPTADCPDCPEYDELCFTVGATEGILVELAWNKGGGIDFELHLVRYRDEGTFGVPGPIRGDAVDPDELIEPTKCETDRDCSKINTNVSKRKESIPYIICNYAQDNSCPKNTYCNYAGSTYEGKKIDICTKHDFQVINDTCFSKNIGPHWGEYTKIEEPCTTFADCNYPGEADFLCSNNLCDYTCYSSAKCTKIGQCGENNECVQNNRKDDPYLDHDAVSWWVPEIIDVDEPISGRYRVVVRLHSSSDNLVSPENIVETRVKIFVNGEMVETYYKDFIQDGTFWKVADIYWDNDKGQVKEIPTTKIVERFEDNPYSNPFVKLSEPYMLGPTEEFENTSIWCDSPDDIYNQELDLKCGNLYKSK